MPKIGDGFKVVLTFSITLTQAIKLKEKAAKAGQTVPAYVRTIIEKDTA